MLHGSRPALSLDLMMWSSERQVQSGLSGSCLDGRRL